MNCMDDIDESPSTYSGGRDAQGQYHGRGTLQYSSGDTFCGRFCHGIRQGRGTLFFADESCLSGLYKDDNLEGPGSYTFADGSHMEATFESGAMNGPAREFDPDGKVTFEGQYADNVRCGVCWCYKPDGGCVVGLADRNGSMTGSQVAYLYPDQSAAIAGKFVEGQLVRGQQAEVISIKSGVPSFRKYGPKLSRDVSTPEKIASDLLLPDPYEEVRVFVAKSTLPDAGEGLFSKVAAPANTVMSFYNGIRLSHREVDGRSWEENGNTISLDEAVVIDVPPPYISTSQYCATLGHKANHSFVPNCMYDHFDHPRFGRIKCIRSTKPVWVNDELTVSYGYDHQGAAVGDTRAPDWYIQQEAEFLRKPAKMKRRNEGSV